MTNAWLFTGGTDSGVMKLVGEAIHKYGLDVPLVGIAPWGAVLGRGHLNGCKGEVVKYRGGNPSMTSAAQPVSHASDLVDAARYDGTMPWGDEIGVRSQLERCYATVKGVPVVLLVIKAGRNTLDMMTASAKEELSLTDTLRLWRCGNGARAVLPRRHQQSDRSGLREGRGEVGGVKIDGCCEEGLADDVLLPLADDDAEESMSTAPLLRCLFRNLMFYQVTPETRSSNRLNMGKVILRAQEAVSRRRDHMQELMLAVKWNQVEFAKRMLVELPMNDDYSRPLAKMLQHALELHRVQIVALLLERPGCDVNAVSLCQLYLQEDPYNYLRSDLNLQARLQRRLSDGTIDGR